MAAIVFSTMDFPLSQSVTGSGINPGVLTFSVVQIWTRIARTVFVLLAGRMFYIVANLLLFSAHFWRNIVIICLHINCRHLNILSTLQTQKMEVYGINLCLCISLTELD